MIDIIINATNNEKELEKTLMSIYLQEKDYPCKVTILGNKKNIDFLNRYNDKLSINYIKLEKEHDLKNIKNIGLDKTEYPYIIYIDSGDLFYNTQSIDTLTQYIEQNIDIISGIEYIEENENIFQDSHSIYAKIFKRKFLKNNTKISLNINNSKIISDIIYIHRNTKENN